MPPESQASVPVLAPTGDLDLASARGLGSELGELAGSPGNAILDLSRVEFMDSVGLGVVLKAAHRFRRQDKSLVLVVPPEGSIARLLDVSGTRGSLAVARDREAAVALAGPER